MSRASPTSLTGLVMDRKTEEEKKAERRERKKVREDGYRARNRQNPEWVAKTKAYQADRYARKRQDSEWVAEQAAKLEEKRQDPKWVEDKRAREAARYQEKKANGETYYDTNIKHDPERVAKKKAWEKNWKNKNLKRWKDIQRRSDERKKQKNPIAFLLRQTKSHSKSKGIEFNIDSTDFVMPERCPVLGIPITPFVSRLAPGTPSFDRIDPRKGYIKGNVKIISNRANRLKCDCTDPEELRAVAKLHRTEFINPASTGPSGEPEVELTAQVAQP